MSSDKPPNEQQHNGRFWLNPGTADKPACRETKYCLLPADHARACVVPVNRQ